MKKFAYVILSITLASVLAGSSAVAETKKAGTNQSAQGKHITKNEAQHLVLQKYPAANIKTCEEKTVNGTSIWVVSFTMTGGNAPQRVQVDAQTGKVTRM